MGSAAEHFTGRFIFSLAQIGDMPRQPVGRPLDITDFDDHLKPYTVDDILGGGFVRGRLHLIEGRLGSGKTTLAMQIVLAERDQSEASLYVSMSEA